MPCPHCGYLVALIVSEPDTVRHCPRCSALRIEPLDPGGPLSGPTAVAEPAIPVARNDAKRIDADGTELESHGAKHGSAADAVADERGTGEATGRPAANAANLPAARQERARRPPSFVRAAQPATRSRLGWPWYVAIAALGLLLGLQLLLAQRHELAASARWRPWVEGLCNALPCEIPAWREPHAFTMLDRSVQPHPTMPGVLAVQARFRNDARWPQPWPTLVLSLSDVEGRQVGLRVFTPPEYREGGGGAGELLAPGQSGTLRLQVREPSPRIVAFTFDFQ